MGSANSFIFYLLSCPLFFLGFIQSQKTAGADSNVLHVGVILPLTGAVSQLGNDFLNGLMLAITPINKVIQLFGFSSWKLLQRFVYLAFVLSVLHSIFDTNGLFIPLKDGSAFVNLAEILLILLGIATILLQIAGVVKKISVRPRAEDTKVE